ncbi:MAG TPA: 2-oxo-4-hydroxy-4-carboxy-5-ureidoimidazoline decarboxylase [Stellaceae bacterium]|nr:2-oxo-4-hydroxy-4-carboxy-5-ureidoimidazoline decarboxylase [Stellaceae bacterium]
MADLDPISLATLNELPHAEFVAVLGNIYEHAAWAAEAAAARRPFATIAAVLAALGDAVRAASSEDRLALVRGHPDLAKRAIALTRDSTAEQGAAGLDQLTSEEANALERLNTAYHARFAHPFILCVRRHTRDSIFATFERRLLNTPEQELATAFAEIDRIAALRLAAGVAGPGSLAVTGQLTTHVLDAERGEPAAGVAVTLYEVRRTSAPHLVWRGATNGNGRTDAPLIADRPVPIGQYELSFEIGAYFAQRRSPAADPPFLDRVPVRFAVADPERHYHVPLLATPWSYTTYRGS